jgi:hypothetical protein|tara:strand:- start:243 stop:410 length:168 start_codon:yes stop_codon:yes gene_type:complete
MRCKICNTKLKDWELSKKDKDNTFLDTCGDCMASVYENINDQEPHLPIEKPLDTD